MRVRALAIFEKKGLRYIGKHSTEIEVGEEYDGRSLTRFAEKILPAMLKDVQKSAADTLFAMNQADVEDDEGIKYYRASKSSPDSYNFMLNPDTGHILLVVGCGALHPREAEHIFANLKAVDSKIEDKKEVDTYLQQLLERPLTTVKIVGVKIQVAKLKVQCLDLIEQLLERGEKLEELVDKTEKLAENSAVFLELCKQTNENQRCCPSGRRAVRRTGEFFSNASEGVAGAFSSGQSKPADEKSSVEQYAEDSPRPL